MITQIDWAKPVWIRYAEIPVIVLSTHAQGNFRVVFQTPDVETLYLADDLGNIKDSILKLENVPNKIKGWVNINHNNTGDFFQDQRLRR